jgi:guanosine-3',5'-bis(diphosphate) 3'-pyrophosphohydrolase
MFAGRRFTPADRMSFHCGVCPRILAVCMAAPVSDVALLLNAVRFAALQHRDQRRRDVHASPFIIHPIETVCLLVQAGVTDTTTLVGGILHDVLEDTQTTAAEVERRFGQAVRRLVEEVTDDRSLPKDERRRRQLERATRASLPARLIRLADKILNLGSLPIQWSDVERHDYVDWAAAVGTALRGTSARLDELFAATLVRARTGLEEPPRNIRSEGTAPPSLLVRHEASEQIVRLLRRLQRTLGGAEELADHIAESLVARRPSPPALMPQPASGAGLNERAPRRRRFTDPRWGALAEPGVGALTIRKHTSRNMLVTINGASEFPLPRRLADLLSAIAFASGSSDDEFTRFQSLEEVAGSLVQSGQACTTHAVTVAVGRLRVMLEKRGHVSPLLVETCRQRGVRFRLRRPELQI